MTPVGQCLPDLAAHCFDMFYPQWEQEGEGARESEREKDLTI